MKTTSNTKLFLELFTPNYRRIQTFILTLLPNWNDAEDVMQETAQVLWEKFDSYTPGTDFLAWALTIARYQVLNQRKRKRPMISLGEKLIQILTDECSKQQDLWPDKLGALQRCVAKLESKEREHIQLRFRDALMPKELANRWGIPVKQVYRRETSIMERLWRCVRRRLAEERMA